MNKTIKIIDLLNIISKGDYEALPLKIKVNGNIYNWDTLEHFYETGLESEDLFDLSTEYDTVTFLDMNVEILEDNTEEIEELETVGYITTGGEKDIKDFVKKTNKVITDNFYLVNKIIENQNKLVKAVNQIRKEKE